MRLVQVGLLLCVAAPIAHADPVAELGGALFFDPRLSLTGQQSCAPATTRPARSVMGATAASAAQCRSVKTGIRSATETHPVWVMHSSSPSLGSMQTVRTGVASFTTDVRPISLRRRSSRFSIRKKCACRVPPLSWRGFAKSRSTCRPCRSSSAPTSSRRTRPRFRHWGKRWPRFKRPRVSDPFDSRYDRYLRGEVEFNELEQRGRRLFFSKLTSCTSCHVLEEAAALNAREPFSDHRYHNIGVPVNQRVRARNGRGSAFIDRGLADHPRYRAIVGRASSECRRCATWQ